MLIVLRSYLQTFAGPRTNDIVAAQPELTGRAVWMAIIVLAAFIIGVLAGFLTWMTKRPPASTAATTTGVVGAIAAAVLYAVVAFGSTIVVLIGMYSFLA